METCILYKYKQPTEPDTNDNTFILNAQHKHIITFEINWLHSKIN